MTYRITHQCIACHHCESTCPTGAITQNGQQYQINSERCNDCVGYYPVPQCWATCPTNGGCVPDRPPRSHFQASSGDYWDTWFSVYDRLISRLNASQPSEYWQRWFDSYSQVLAKQLQSSTSVGVNA